MAISFSNNIKIQPITYQEFINSEYIPEYGEMVIISDYKQDENGINVPSFTVGDGSTILKNLKISVDYVPTYTWSEINDKPTFADVATSGSYEDLTNKPTLSTFGITATATELNYTDGVTSNIQTQLNNKVTTNSAASLTSLNIKGSANSTAIIGSDAANNLFVKTNNNNNNNNGSAEFVIYPTVVRPGKKNTNAIELGNTDSYWKSVRSGKYIVHGGTSSQFLKADGSLDSTSYQSTITDLDTIRSNASTAYGWGNHADAGYATLNEEGKVEKSILADDLGGREETFEEEFVFQPTADDLSIKDGYAKIKKIKGTTLLWNQSIDNSKDSNFTSVKQNSSSTSTLIINEDYLRFNYDGDHYDSIYYNIKGFDSYNEGDTFLLSLWVRVSAKGTIGFGQFQGWEYKKFNSDDIGKWKQCIYYGQKNSSNVYGPVLCRCTPSSQRVIDIRRDIICVNLTRLNALNINSYDEFRALFPNETYPYNAGQLLSFNESKLKTVGFNAFNGEYAKVLSAQTYYLSGEITAITFKKSIEEEGESVEIPTDNLYTPATNGYLYVEGLNVCVHLQHTGYHNGDCEPYEEFVLPLDFIKTINDSNNTLLFPDGELNSVGEVYDEIRSISNTHCIAVKRVGKRAYQAGDESLENVITDNTNTIYVLDTPIESEPFEQSIEYVINDFGTEEIIADQEDESVPIVPFRAEIQYGFNATDEIRNNRFIINDLKKKVQELSSNDVKIETIQITHEELKSLRDSRELIKGAKYEITDYKTIINGNSLLDLSLESVKNSLGLNETISWATGITASTDERVLFNIIVTATDVDTLYENAIAIYDSERGSDYLSQAKVSQWELKYDLDNNTTKYAWASENGYGVIYYMKDEWGNECPYDFKSITFINTAGNAISNIQANKQYYTFTVTLNDGTLTDMSVPIKGEDYSYLNISSNSQCLFNKISSCIGNLDGYNKLYLNNNIFNNVDGGICIYNIYHNSSFHNYYYNNCSNNTMHGKYYANIHGADCSNNKFAGVTWGNIFKDWASWSTFGDAFMKNTIGEYSYYNTFGDYVYNNTIGASSTNNTFEQAIQNNTIDSEFVDNYIGQNFSSNTIGNKCKSNVFRGLFQNNTLGNSTSHCDFGVQTTHCKFGNSNDSIITKGHNAQIELGSECGAITFGIDCDLIKFYSNESTNTLKNRVFAVEVGDGNRGLYITTSDSNLDNVDIKRGVITTVGTITDDKILRLTINNTSTKYETIVTRRDNNDIYIGTMDNYYPSITEEDINLLFN